MNSNTTLLNASSLTATTHNSSVGSQADHPSSLHSFSVNIHSLCHFLSKLNTMFDKTTIWAATAASLALLTSVSAELSPELQARKLPDCIPSTKFNDIQDKGKFWSESGAEQFADDYINSRTDHSQWAQNLYRDLFEDKVHSMFDCESPDASCVITAECSQYKPLTSTFSKR